MANLSKNNSEANTVLLALVSSKQEVNDLTAEQNKAGKVFGDKLYVIKYKNAVAIVRRWIWLPSVISVAIGANSVVVGLASFPFWFAAIIGLLLSLIIEGLKVFSSEIGFPSLFQGKKNVWLLVTALCYLLSAGATILGVVNGHSTLEYTTVSKAIGTNKFEQDSVASYYDKRLATINSQIEQFRSDNMVKKDGVVAWTARDAYSKMVSDRGEVEKEKSRAILAIDAQKPSVITAAKDASMPFLFVAVVIGLMLESLIFGGKYFEAEFAFMVNKERLALDQVQKELVEAAKKNGTMLDLSSKSFLQSFIQEQFGLSANAQSGPIFQTQQTPQKSLYGGGFASKNPIGFQKPTAHQQPTPPIAQQPLSVGNHVPTLAELSARSNTVANNVDVAEMLLQGASYGQIIKITGKSKSTCQNVKKQLQTAGML